MHAERSRGGEWERGGAGGEGEKERGREEERGREGGGEGERGMGNDAVQEYLIKTCLLQPLCFCRLLSSSRGLCT